MRIALASLVALTWAVAASAQPPRAPGHHPPPPPDQILAEHAETLDIDAETLAEARRIMEAAKPELDRLHREARAAHDAVRIKREAVMDEVMDLLSDEQRARLESLLPPPPPPWHAGPPPRR